MVGFSPRLALLDLATRLVIKRRLAREQDPIRLRAQFERDARFFRVPRDAKFEDESIPRPEGPAMHALWASRGPVPGARAILLLHGGAFLMGSSATHRHVAAVLAGHVGGRALVPDYRLGPEHAFPAPIEDALTAYRFLLAGGLEPARIVLVGDSAGGGLVFSLLLRLAEERLPMPAAVAAFSPWVDLTMTSPSVGRNARRDALLPAERFADVIAMYLRGHDPRDGLASPVLGRFRAPPPALILASEEETLRDEAVAMAETLRRDGGEATVELWPGLTHDWVLLWGYLAEAERALKRVGDFLRERVGAP